MKSPHPPAPRGRPRGFDRAEAVKAALRVFHKLGYEGTTLTALLAAMGNITPPSFYSAFGSKEALFRETVSLYGQAMATEVVFELDSQPTARQAITALLRRAVEAFTKPGEPTGCLFVQGALNCSGANTKIEKHLQQIRVRTLKRLEARIEQGQQDGDVPSKVDAKGLAAFFMALLYGLSIEARDGASKASLVAAVEVATKRWP